MQGVADGTVVRAGLALAAFGLAAAALVAVTDGTTFPAGVAPTVTLAPAAAVVCTAAGPYRAPDPGSAGVPPGLALCPGGSLTVVAEGMVIDGWDVRGGIVVAAPDVVVRRTRVTGDGGAYGIHTTGAGSVRIEDTTLTGDFTQAAVGGDRWTGERIEITRVTHDGAHLGDGARLRNSIVHDFAGAPGAEQDAVVLTGAASRLEDNRIELGTGAGPGGGSAVLLAPDRDTGRADGPLVIRGNVLGGGRYTVAQDLDSAEPADVLISGNRFHRDAEQGPMRILPGAVLTDNGYLDGGSLPRR